MPCNAGSASLVRIIPSGSAAVDRIRPLFIWALSALCLSTAGCRDRPADDIALRWSFSRAWLLSDSQGAPRTFDDLLPFQVAVADSGRFYVLDHSARRLLIADWAGTVLDSLGRQGAGPGELEEPMAVVAIDNGVGVVDLATRRIVRWAGDARLLEPEPIRGGIEHPKLAIRGSEVWYTTSGRAASGVSEYQLTAVSAAGTRVLATAAKQPRRVGDFPSCHATEISVQPIFAPVLLWDAAGKYLAVSNSAGYMIELSDNGAHAATIRRDIAPISASRQAAEREVRDWKFNGCSVPANEVLNVAGFMSAIPVIKALAVSPVGEVWVLRLVDWKPPERNRIDIFDSKGTYLGSLPDHAPFPAAFLSTNRILAIESDSLDLAHLVAYDIHRAEMRSEQ